MVLETKHGWFTAQANAAADDKGGIPGIDHSAVKEIGGKDANRVREPSKL